MNFHIFPYLIVDQRNCGMDRVLLNMQACMCVLVLQQTNQQQEQHVNTTTAYYIIQ